MSQSDRLYDAKQRWQAWQNEPEYQDRLDTRLKVLDACNRSKEAQVYSYSLAKEDIFFFIENFGFTYDPRPEFYPNHVPLILFPFQRETVEWTLAKIENGEDGLIEKSRDMGATWLFVYVFVHKWLFSESFSGLLGSYKEKLVDDRTVDSLFGKIDYIIRGLPGWMLPKRFKFKEHRQSMKLVNPETYNLITGDTMNPNFARGSRKQVVFMDEGASWEYFRDAWESAGDTTPCRMTVSTPKGRNAFALLREGDIDVLTLHWKKHPLKDETWYEFEKQRRTDEELAQEVDISYHRSQEGRVYPEWDSVDVGHFPYRPELPLYVSWDFGTTDDTAMIWWQSDPSGEAYIIDAYANKGKTIDFYVPFINGIAPSGDPRYTKRDYAIIEEHQNWKPAIHFGDPAGRFTQQITNQSVIDILGQYGITVHFREEAKDFQSRKTATKLLLPRTHLHDNDRTKDLSIAIENASYPKTRYGGQDEIRSAKPRHDWTCLAGDAEVRTLSGWIPIQDLNGKSNFWVWSYSESEGRLVPALASKAWKTHDNAPLIEVLLDNKVSIKTTPEHLFMLRDGTWKRCDSLCVGDSLMPFYEFNNRGYARVDLNDGSVADEHTYIFSRVNGHLKQDFHIDHIDGNKSNNNPSNLQQLSMQEHCGKTFRGKNMDERRSMSKLVKNYETKYSRSLIVRDCLWCESEFDGDHKTLYCSKKCQSSANKNRNSFSERKKRNHTIRGINRVSSGGVFDIEVPVYNNFVANGVVVHNSHYRSALEYFAVNFDRVVRKKARVVDKFKKKQRSSARVIGY